ASVRFFFSSRRRHTRWPRDWSSDVCSSDLAASGPATLGIAEVALILSEVTGREFTYVDVPEAAARDGMLQAGVPQWQVELVMELHAVNKQNRWSAVTSDVEKVTGTAPTDFAQFARDHADKFRAS